MQQSSVTREQDVLIMQLMLKTLEGNKRIEVARKTLASNALFEPYDLFKVLDASRKFFVDMHDILGYMKSVYPSVRPSNIQFLMDKICRPEGKLDYDAFTKAILPREYGKPYRNVYQQNKQSIDQNPDIPHEIKLDLINLFKCLHDEHLTFDKCMSAVVASRVTGKQMFYALAEHAGVNADKGFLNHNDFSSALRSVVHYLGRWSSYPQMKGMLCH